MAKLQGKVALVTGSGRNIGRATVLKLAAEGAHIVVNARANQQEAESVAREVRDLGVKSVPILADVGNKEEVERMAEKALSEFGRVDILINNAAIRPHKPFTEVTDEDWERVRNVVLDGAFYLTRALIPAMVRNKYGRILFFCGDGSISAHGHGRAHLSAAKMGLIGMARGLASEFAAHNIRVNVVSPGSMAKLGFGVLMVMQNEWPKAAEDILRYREIALAAGHQPRPPIILTNVCCAESRDEAHARAFKYLGQKWQSIDDHYHFSDGHLSTV
jgi:3-oxoacyl-[acyl-carrier protein] reductase